jgi:hypothetical protein
VPTKETKYIDIPAGELVYEPRSDGTARLFHPASGAEIDGVGTRGQLWPKLWKDPNVKAWARQEVARRKAG